MKTPVLIALFIIFITILTVESIPSNKASNFSCNSKNVTINYLPGYISNESVHRDNYLSKRKIMIVDPIETDPGVNIKECEADIHYEGKGKIGTISYDVFSDGVIIVEGLIF